MPDTQFLTERAPRAFDCQTEWIVANRDKLNIKYVLHLGDLVQGNIPLEWERVGHSTSFDPYLVNELERPLTAGEPLHTVRINLPERGESRLRNIRIESADGEMLREWFGKR